MKVRITSSIVVAAFLVGATVTAAPQKVQLNDLPPAVQRAIREQTKGATVTSVTQESDLGKVQFEVESIRDGKSRDLLFDSFGSLMEVEEEVSLGATPAAVRTALLAHGRVVKVEAVTRGSVVTYEAEIGSEGRRAEVQVDADGRAVKR